MTEKTDTTGATAVAAVVADVKPGNEYAALLTELDTFSKALKADCADGEGEGGKKIIAAAEDGKEGKDKDKVDENGEEAFGKAFTVTLDDGTKVEAFDGTAMMKALRDQNAVLTTQLVVVEANSGALLKSLQIASASMQDMRTELKNQGDLVKALKADIDRIGNQGGGRRAVISVHDKSTVTEAGGGNGNAKPTPSEILTKSMAAFNKGAINGLEVARVEARLGRGEPVPDELMDRINAAAA